MSQQGSCVRTVATSNRNRSSGIGDNLIGGTDGGGSSSNVVAEASILQALLNSNANRNNSNSSIYT